MNAGRTAAPGATRVCPHCRATILESAAVCPACRHHLRFEDAAARTAARRTTPLQVEGTLCGPSGERAWEYTVVVAIRDERGEEIARHVVGVGALAEGESRTFSLGVEAVEVAAPARVRRRR
ncbi:FxLYD domain-containing protein [Vulcaniibacterium thermophilum]|uniref:Uncharacterized protein n=1 Tax=Vulcaniibacterium thermophilum TaxID=1169913 RepID=A0A918YVV9_9GAMM|nr:FxLYD domain-containing protein [Vulcaniibacterium thermophilum]GHE25775.1 hypothetical protein GCM10007167_03330 [Vulcaniibacterium thermophilum]